MPNLETLSAKKLNQEIEKRSERHTETLKELITAGYGDFTGSQLDALIKAGNAPKMVIDARKESKAYFAASDEMERRKRYHGSEKPIKKNHLF